MSWQSVYRSSAENLPAFRLQELGRKFADIPPTGTRQRIRWHSANRNPAEKLPAFRLQERDRKFASRGHRLQLPGRSLELPVSPLRFSMASRANFEIPRFPSRAFFIVHMYCYSLCSRFGGQEIFLAAIVVFVYCFLVVTMCDVCNYFSPL